MNSKLNQSELQTRPASYTPTRLVHISAGQMGRNSQVLGHRTVVTNILFTNNQSQVVTELLTN